MGRFLPLRTLLVLCCLSLLAACPAWAWHPHAGQLTYQYQSTNGAGEQVYLARAAIVRECSNGAPIPTTEELVAVTSCRATPRRFALAQVGPPRGSGFSVRRALQTSPAPLQIK